MYHKILVPLDGSKPAEAVLPHACALAERFTAEIVLLRVPADPADDLMFTGPKLVAATRGRTDALRREAIDYLEQLAAELEDAGLCVATLVCDGPVVETIVGCAEKVRADLIVISSQGKGGLTGWPTGSVAYRLLHQARVPVLLVTAEPGEHQAV